MIDLDNLDTFHLIHIQVLHALTYILISIFIEYISMAFSKTPLFLYENFSEEVNLHLPLFNQYLYLKCFELLFKYH